jgi:hypothetical protein
MFFFRGYSFKAFVLKFPAKFTDSTTFLVHRGQVHSEVRKERRRCCGERSSETW